MNTLVILGCIFAVGAAQRPTYAGSSPKVYPQLASRFRETSSSSDSTDPTDNTIVNRIGEDGPQTTIKIPIDARGDVDLVQRLNQWPRDNRPFWLINADHIENHRNPDASSNQQLQSRSSFDFDPSFDFDSSFEVRTIKPPQQRSSFLGPIDRR